ncbi:class I SAM-dependent methyltransferase [Variovorax sp. S2]|uniref:class I SAM-dependent methyltransferase n=1 Tax=Variovorax sp. S12S4 TaxID=3029170 RepID=UPI00215B99EF|nr:class I SAM-dependent methyltransferase [Variovorax sp. S12S4]MCR8956699.1 class I SAM-dependent methyltransferase [Variovorax sp. S12S4]
MPDLPHSPAADRNKQPILEALTRILGERGAALEIASGTGQHAAWFAAAMPRWTWQPTDADARMLPALEARVEEAALPNLRPPLLLDVTAPQWPSQGAAFGQGEEETKFDAIYCANMLHIAPWAACVALMHGASRHLLPGGVLITYGPYFEEDAVPAPSNLAFDEDLRSRNSGWGIRRLKDVAAEARAAGLSLRERQAMPANNLLLVFGR